MSTYSAVPADNPDEQCDSGPPSYEASQAEYESNRLLESTHDGGGSEETTNDENRINERTDNDNTNITDTSDTTTHNTNTFTTTVNPPHIPTFTPLIVVDAPSDSSMEHAEHEDPLNKTTAKWNRNMVIGYYVTWFAINAYLFIAMLMAIGYVGNEMTPEIINSQSYMQDAFYLECLFRILPLLVVKKYDPMRFTLPKITGIVLGKEDFYFILCPYLSDPSLIYGFHLCQTYYAVYTMILGLPVWIYSAYSVTAIDDMAFKVLIYVGSGASSACLLRYIVVMWLMYSKKNLATISGRIRAAFER
ncbi:7265_t:CDS:2 [Paraglomus occultum]|uniref:7265_t:CDS:1 n=1 Tax=Paraglomus occultum TaxID=144539 RepID=A0A9N9AFM8_9GLOM|nr:7265_t:CDS:2 [Paraglomus occultum]